MKEVYKRLSQGLYKILVMTQIMIKGYHLSNVGDIYYLDTSYSKNLKGEDKLINLIQLSGRNKDKMMVHVDSYRERQDWFPVEGCYLRDIERVAKLGNCLVLSLETKPLFLDLKRMGLVRMRGYDLKPRGRLLGIRFRSFLLP